MHIHIYIYEQILNEFPQNVVFLDTYALQTPKQIHSHSLAEPSGPSDKSQDFDVVCRGKNGALQQALVVIEIHHLKPPEFPRWVKFVRWGD